jgi:hypothetical protein
MSEATLQRLLCSPPRHARKHSQHTHSLESIRHSKASNESALCVRGRVGRGRASKLAARRICCLRRRVECLPSPLEQVPRLRSHFPVALHEQQ